MTRNVIEITGRTVHRYVQSLMLKNVVFILAIARARSPKCCRAYVVSHENAVAHAQSPILKNAVFIFFSDCGHITENAVAIAVACTEILSLFSDRGRIYN